MHGRQCCWQQELDSALKSVKAKRNVLLLSPEHSGKSSFLLSLQHSLQKAKSFVPVIFSAERCVTLNQYVSRNLLRVLEAHNEIFAAPKSLFSLSLLELDSRISALKISDEAKQSLKLLLMFENDPKVRMEDVLEALFTFPQKLAAEVKASSVILLDDAELLQGIKSDRISASYFFELFRAGKLGSAFVIASSNRPQLEGLDELTLKPLTLEQTRTMLKDRELEVDEKALTTIYNFAEGVPFYINYVGRLVETSSKRDAESVKELLEAELDNSLNIYFSERLKSLSPKELPILFCMAEHNVNTPSRISKLLNYSQTNVRRFLSIMEEKGFVTLKERGVFEIHDPVFRRWLEVQSRS
ncbi:hypothetical protein KY359_04730 [Candidatus Woesearchaeota archaeon]|nr:hypothetical protein [Candidatus Woesearchaeota archaeon]